jgi:transcriptional regulator with XRE-family HTH domain
MNAQETKTDIAKRIKRGRIALGYSLSELARRVGVSPQAVQQWEFGKTSPKGENLRKLSNVLNFTPQFLQYGNSDIKLNEPAFSSLKDLEQALDSSHFHAIYHASVTHMMTVAVESGWIKISPEFSPVLIADIGLNHLRWLKSTKRLNAAVE